MKAESHSINDVLAKNSTSFFIPPFQRAYAWGRPEIERYYCDMMRIIESELDTKQHDKLEHFFGTIVIKEEGSGFAHRAVVVDGQQRLTTTLLFLIALRDSETDNNARNFITQNYLLNSSSQFADKIKLKQVTRDWEAYRALVNHSASESGLISNAYKIFLKLISDSKSINVQIKSEHYIQAIQRMNVAVIFLDERPFKGEDPQIIFETLNSLGKPLTLSDLVRNFVLLNMKSDDQTEIYERTWYPKIEADLQDFTSEFFRDYLQYKTNSPIKAISDNNTKEIYAQFKDFVNQEFSSHNAFIEDIVRYVKFYKWIINEKITDIIVRDVEIDKEIKELLRNIFHDIKSEAFKPFVLGLLEHHHNGVGDSHLSDEALLNSLRAIRTYLIRRRILGLTQGENKSIVLLCNRISTLTKADRSMFDLLSTMIYRLRLPNDDEIRYELLTMNFYEQLKKYSKFIFGKIEEYRSKVAVDFRDSRITIEHIMPQTLSKGWKDELGDGFEETHKNYLHNIGNLILTEFNSEIGNRSFLEKKQRIETSSLGYRFDILKKDHWNETSIQEHRDLMINALFKTFPLPEGYKSESNWNTENLDRIAFSPFDDDAKEIAEGNKPSSLRFYDVTFKLKTWQEVFIYFLSLGRDNSYFDFDFIIGNQSELFGNDTTILKWSSLRHLIRNKEELSSRYKTFAGEFWKDAKDRTDDTIFIHINISANTCISRIANIMDKFSIESDAVEITLK